MMRMYRLLLLLVLVMFLQPASARPFPKKVKRVLILGNSITYAGKYVTDLEVYLLARYPKQRYEIFNVGLPSETVSGLSEDGHANGKFPRPDLHERLDRVLKAIKPDLVIADYGMNDGIYLPLDRERFDRFKSGMVWLHQEVEKAGAYIIHATPPVHDDKQLGVGGYNLVLDQYADWLLRTRDSLNWKVADVHFPMKKFLEEKRRDEPGFVLARDGIHPEALGHWLMAKELLGFLGEKKVSKMNNVTEILKDKGDDAQKIYKLVEERQLLMRDAWLTATGHLRPGIKAGLPLDQAMSRYKAIDGELTLLLARKKAK